jgi:hypothetical protein
MVLSSTKAYLADEDYKTYAVVKESITVKECIPSCKRIGGDLLVARLTVLMQATNASACEMPIHLFVSRQFHCLKFHDSLCACRFGRARMSRLELGPRPFSAFID